MKKLLLFVSLFVPVALCAMEKRPSTPRSPRSPRTETSRGDKRLTRQLAKRKLSVSVNPLFNLDTEEKQKLLKRAMKNRVDSKIAKLESEKGLKTAKIEKLKRISKEIQKVSIDELKRASQEFQQGDYALIKGQLQTVKNPDNYAACFEVQSQLAQDEDETADFLLAAWRRLRKRDIGKNGTLTALSSTPIAKVQREFKRTKGIA